MLNLILMKMGNMLAFFVRLSFQPASEKKLKRNTEFPIRDSEKKNFFTAIIDK